MSKVLAVINFLDSEGRPDQSLPGHGHPDNSLPGHGHPDNSLPPWVPAPPRPWPPTPTDPDWGVEGRPPHVGFVPGTPAPGQPDNTLPSGGVDHPAPPIASTPPGTIWPPLPVTNPPAPPGNAAILVWIIGVGWRFIVATIPTAEPK